MLSRLTVCTVVLAISRMQVEAQSDSGKVTVTVREGERPLVEAVVRSGHAHVPTDALGEATLWLPVGVRRVIVAGIGFRPETLHVAVRVRLDTTLTVQLVEQATALAPVLVTATRTPRRLEDEPMRVEVLAGEDITEKTEMRPADLTVLLSEISGVRVQPTVPAIGAANLRIQGLPGRYSELLSDGLPLYGGPVGGLGLLQIPPLDLRQAEVIKGAATALYGPSALGGVVNLVSRAPGNEDEILLNRTSRSGTDGVAWATRQLNDRWGYTLLAGVHRQQPVDVDGDGWADLPSVQRAELRPRVYWNGARGRRAFATIGGMVEDRKGGTMAGAVAPNGQHFPEGVKTTRFDGGVVASFPVGERDTVTVRGAATGQWHRHEFGPTVEHHRHSTLFSELAVTLPRGQATWLVGAAFERDGLQRIGHLRLRLRLHDAVGIRTGHLLARAAPVRV